MFDRAKSELKSELRGRAGRSRKGSKGRRGASRRRQAGGVRSMARRLTGRARDRKGRALRSPGSAGSPEHCFCDGSGINLGFFEAWRRPIRGGCYRNSS